MKFYFDGQFCEYPWQFIESPDEIKNHIITPLNFFKKNTKSWQDIKHKGVRLFADNAFDDLVGIDCNAFSVIEIHFPKFTDGRGYSLSYRLVNDLGYTGMLVACGDVLVDQIKFMKQLGIQGFLFDKDYILQQVQSGLNQFSHFLQDDLLEK